MDTKTWIGLSVVLLLIGLYPLLAIVFDWPMKWRSVRTGRETYSMSVAGKLAATVLPLIIVFWGIASTGKVWPIGYVIGISLTIFAAVAIAHDVHQQT